MKRLALALFLVVVQAGPTWAGWEEGNAAYDRGDYGTALREFKPLAEQGYPGAQYNLGLVYDAGQGVPQDDAEAASGQYNAERRGILWDEL